MSGEGDSGAVQLGFSEPLEEQCDVDAVAHKSPFWSDWDGGKIGGNPSWLNPKDLPQEVLRCVVCAGRNADNGKADQPGTLLRFVAQIYSPADAETGNEDAFHRSLYVFCCPNPICSSAENAHESVVVLRGQLPRENKFYPLTCDGDVDESWDKHTSEKWGVNLCIVSGQRATGRCPVSNQWFACKDHQRDYHKALKKAKGKAKEVDLSSLIYAESELVVEDEPLESSMDENTNEDAIANDINKGSIFADEGDKSDELLEQSDLNEMTGIGAGTTDPITLEFYTRIGRADGDVKSQCLRYSRWPDEEADSDELEQNNGPLWISSNQRPDAATDIPPCEYCGAPRKFEAQVMPQIITFLKASLHDNEDNMKNTDLSEEGKQALLEASGIVDKATEEGTENSLPQGFKERQEELVGKFRTMLLQDDQRGEALDFGTIVCFSCTASCGGGGSDGPFGAYRKEFAWRQKPLE